MSGKRTWLERLVVWVAGGVSFWGASYVVHRAAGAEFSGKQIPALSLAIVIAVVVMYTVAKLLTRRLAWTAVTILLGIWVLGPASGLLSGWTTVPHYRSDVVVMVFTTLLFPVYTPIAAVYDGSAVALGACTILLVILHFLVDLRAGRLRSKVAVS